jgi:DNA-binding response OmpR family regulator
MRRKGHTIPILMLTSVNAAMGLSIGKDDEVVPVDEFQEKPVDPANLVDKVKRLLQK